MSWDYKLTKKEIEALIFLKDNNGEIIQEIADEKIHWRVQHNLYVKLLTDNIISGKGCKILLTKRGYDALNDL
jgi:hypothetical protein